MSSAAHPAWTVLDTQFGRGAGLLHSAAHWAQDPHAGVLHYVALCDVADLPRWRGGQHIAADVSPLALELNTACSTTLPGIQRLLLQGGRLSLTLCAGPVQAMLSEQVFQADEVRLVWDADSDPLASDWDKWAVQLLARRCRRGTQLHCEIKGVRTASAGFIALQERLAVQGFVWGDTGADSSPMQPALHQAQYQPRWELRTTRTAAPKRRLATNGASRCAVIGAGLAGASVAHALALRGWQVTVLDTHAEPAQGASGLPAGLVVPHVSVDDSPRSRMSRAGLRLTLAHAQRLLQRGTDWDATGVLERSTDAPRRLAANHALQTAGWLATDNAGQGLWHPHAAWIKPARLIAAWLSHPGVQWLGSCEIAHCKRQDAGWVLQDSHSKTLTTADVVVVANAAGALALLQGMTAAEALPPDLLRKLQLLQSLYGTISHGSMPDATDPNPFPPFPVNGNGSLIANLPTQQGLQQGLRWYAGATYETDHAAANALASQHAENFHRLQTLLPQASAALSGQFSNHQVQAWTGTRCVSHDRLPLVGPVDADGHSGLWLNIAMGSRGLSFAALCAEYLAARLGHEPLPVEAHLLRSLDAHRPLRRQTASRSAD